MPKRLLLEWQLLRLQQVSRVGLLVHGDAIQKVAWDPMIYLHKILPVLFSPIVLVMLAVWLSIATRLRGLAYAALVFLYVTSMPVTGDALTRMTERYALRTPVSDAISADAIVVLSGMVRYVESKDGLIPEWGDAADRFFAGVDLYHAGKGKDIYFTGGKLPWTSSQDPEGVTLARMAQALDIPDRHIHVTPDAQNTEQEANALRKMIQPQDVSILLVTSAFHMPRAMMLFEKAGFRSVIPFPVDFRVGQRELTVMDFMPDPEALFDTDRAVREALGIAYYRLKHL